MFDDFWDHDFTDAETQQMKKIAKRKIRKGKCAPRAPPRPSRAAAHSVLYLM